MGRWRLQIMENDYSIAMVLFVYDPCSGDITYRKNVGTRGVKGEKAGSLNHGYRRIKMGGKAHGAHRIAWLLYYKKWPDGEIDHINGNPDDNRIANLRDVSHATNGRNQRMHHKTESGIMGVRKIRRSGKWQARICHEGETTHLGTYDYLLQAACARWNAEAAYKFHENHGLQTWSTSTSTPGPTRSSVTAEPRPSASPSSPGAVSLRWWRSAWRWCWLDPLQYPQSRSCAPLESSPPCLDIAKSRVN